MRNFIKIFIIYTLITQFNAFSQNVGSEAKFMGGDVALNKFLDKQFHEESKKFEWPSCIISVVFAKFTIDSAGNIKGLTFSHLNSTPQVLRTMLTSAILATNGHWIPCKVNGKAAESKPFILPLVYDLESGCNPQNVVADSVKRIYKPIPNNTSTAIRYILDFENNVGDNNIQLDCVLLQPIQIFSIN